MLNKDNFDDVFDEIIRKAQAEGKFDNLSGQGQPLRFRTNPNDPAGGVLDDVLKENHYVPEWLALRQEIDQTFQQLCQQVLQTESFVREGLNALTDRTDLPAAQERNFLYEERRRARHTFTIGALALNKKIAELNLKVPHPHFQRFALDPAEQLSKLGLT